MAITNAGAQLDDRDTFLGVGSNRLVRWDQRVKEGAVQDALSSPSVVGYAGGKDYARNTNFSCMATSGILLAALFMSCSPTQHATYNHYPPLFVTHQTTGNI